MSCQGRFGGEGGGIKGFNLEVGGVKLYVDTILLTNGEEPKAVIQVMKTFGGGGESRQERRL